MDPASEQPNNPNQEQYIEPSLQAEEQHSANEQPTPEASASNEQTPPAPTERFNPASTEERNQPSFFSRNKKIGAAVAAAIAALGIGIGIGSHGGNDNALASKQPTETSTPANPQSHTLQIGEVAPTNSPNSHEITPSQPTTETETSPANNSSQVNTQETTPTAETDKFDFTAQKETIPYSDLFDDDAEATAQIPGWTAPLFVKAEVANPDSDKIEGILDEKAVRQWVHNLDTIDDYSDFVKNMPGGITIENLKTAAGALLIPRAIDSLSGRAYTKSEQTLYQMMASDIDYIKNHGGSQEVIIKSIEIPGIETSSQDTQGDVAYVTEEYTNKNIPGIDPTDVFDNTVTKHIDFNLIRTTINGKKEYVWMARDVGYGR